MQRFNLSQWSITHRPLVLFVIILLGAAGIYSYLNLGRAEDPSFTIKTMIVHVGWPGATAAELQAQAVDKVEKKLQELPYLDRIGERPQKIFIEFSHATRAMLGLTPQQIFDSVARQNAVVSGGSVDTSADRINLRVTGAFTGVAAIAAVPVQADGQIFRLGDVASVRRGYEDPPTFLVRVDGKPALGLGVSMQDGANIITLGENLKAAMDAIIAELPLGLEVTQIADQPKIVEHSVSEFVETFIEALGIVLLVSFLSLGWRAGI